MEQAWTNLAWAVMCGVMPFIGCAGMVIGRMQATDEIDRNEHPNYQRRDGRVATLSIMEDA